MKYVWCLMEETLYEGDHLQGVYTSLEAARAGAVAKKCRRVDEWVDDGDGGLYDSTASFGGDAIRRWEVES